MTGKDVDPAFLGAGAKEGMELWRIEKMKPVKLEKIDGSFHVGDSYILLVTTRVGGTRKWSLHFWLGEETTQDESGVAAYKAVELDDAIGGGAVHYREVQGNESALFLSYFRETGGVHYLPGGVDSGFVHVERDVWPLRLLHIKGSRQAVRVSNVPVNSSSLNRGDVFILDAGLDLYLFAGPDSNTWERTKAMHVVSTINSDQRGGRATVHLLADEPKNPGFWDTLGGYIDPTTLPIGEPDESVTPPKYPMKLFRISDASGDMEFTCVTPASGKLTRDLLDTNDVFMLQATSGNLYLWVGKHSNINEKREGMIRAVEYARNNNLPPHVQVSRVSEGTETAAFISHFAVWTLPTNFSYKSVANNTADQTVEVKEVLARRVIADTPIDDGSGKIQMWVIRDFKKVEIPDDQYGLFYSGDCYIVLYTYMDKHNREKYILYFWLGNDATNEDKGSAALLTVELDDAMGGAPVQVRVTQGKEPTHFRSLFKGKMVIFNGGRQDIGNTSEPTADLSDIALFHVRGSNEVDTVAVQVPAESKRLNSEDAFILITPDTAMPWYGVGANTAEQRIAKQIATRLATVYLPPSTPRVIEPSVSEGNEPDSFWVALGGKTEYASVSAHELPPRDPRLFLASTATGQFRVEEVQGFTQSDLCIDDVLLLDTWSSLFVWIGSGATDEERTKSWDFAQRYVAEADDGRDINHPIVRVTAHQEPSIFTAHFQGWDDEYFNKQIFADPYAARRQAIEAANQEAKRLQETEAAAKAAKAAAAIAELENKKAAKTPTPPVADEVPAVSPPPAAEVAQPVPGSYTYDQLKENWPADVIPQRREEYLSDAEFLTVFTMERSAFTALPKWRRDDAKKRAGLF